MGNSVIPGPPAGVAVTDFAHRWAGRRDLLNWQPHDVEWPKHRPDAAFDPAYEELLGIRPQPQ